MGAVPTEAKSSESVDDFSQFAAQQRRHHVLRNDVIPPEHQYHYTRSHKGNENDKLFYEKLSETSAGTGATYACGGAKLSCEHGNLTSCEENEVLLHQLQKAEEIQLYDN